MNVLETLHHVWTLSLGGRPHPFHVQVAESGSVYVEWEGRNIVRVSDHADASSRTPWESANIINIFCGEGDLPPKMLRPEDAVSKLARSVPAILTTDAVTHKGWRELFLPGDVVGDGVDTTEGIIAANGRVLYPKAVYCVDGKGYDFSGLPPEKIPYGGRGHLVFRVGEEVRELILGEVLPDGSLVVSTGPYVAKVIPTDAGHPHGGMEVGGVTWLTIPASRIATQGASYAHMGEDWVVKYRGSTLEAEDRATLEVLRSWGVTREDVIAARARSQARTQSDARIREESRMWKYGWEPDMPSGPQYDPVEWELRGHGRLGTGGQSLRREADGSICYRARWIGAHFVDLGFDLHFWEDSEDGSLIPIGDHGGVSPREWARVREFCRPAKKAAA